jgi:hypothetical protein
MSLKTENFMKITDNKKGYALLAVMVTAATVTGLILASGSFNTSLNRQIIRELKDARSFWAAEAGIQQMRSLLQAQISPLGSDGLPSTGTNLISQTFTDDSSFTLSATSLSSAFSQYKYQLSCTGSYMDETRTISITAQLDSMAQTALGTTNKSSSVYFTSTDRIIGELYMNGVICLKTYDGSTWPSFSGTAYSTESYVTLTGGYLDGDNGNVTYPDGYENDVFLAGIYLDYPMITFNSSTYLSDISSAADQSFTDGSDYELTFNSDGTLSYVKGTISFSSSSGGGGGGGSSSSTSYGTFTAKTGPNASSGTISLTDAKTLYFSGDIALKGEVNGQVTIGTASTCLIEEGGITYEAAADTVDSYEWSESEVATLNSSDDLLGVVSYGDIICMGSDDIEVQGAFLSMTGGMYPYQRDTYFGSDKPSLYLYGSLNEAVFEYTEGGTWSGFGMKISCDPRFSSTSLANFPTRSYSYSNWQEG